MGQHRQLEMFVNNTNSVHPVNMQDLYSNMLQQHGRPMQQVNLRAAWQRVVEVVFKAAGRRRWHGIFFKACFRASAKLKLSPHEASAGVAQNLEKASARVA